MDDGDNGATASDYFDRFAFDLVGNRLSKARDAGNGGAAAFVADETTSYVYDANDHLRSESKDELAGGSTNDANTVYEYGASNLGTAQTSETVRVGSSTVDQGTTQKTQTFEYNLQGKLKTATTVENSTTTVSQYEYDEAGFRVVQTVTVNGGAPTTTRYVVDAQNPTGYTQILEEKDAAGSVTKTYTLGLDVVTQAAAMAAYYLLYDAHGSTRALLNNSANVVLNGSTPQLFTYDAYGKLVNLAGLVSGLESTLTSLLYSGEWRDKVTGWDYLRARWMHDGRFNSLDPFIGNFINPLTLQKYLYTHTQNPTGHTQILEEKDAAGNVTKTYTLGIDVVTQAAGAAAASLALRLFSRYGLAIEKLRPIRAGATSLSVARPT